MTSKEMEQNAARAGARAVIMGKQPKDNPFMAGTLFHMLWKDAYETLKANVEKSDASV